VWRPLVEGGEGGGKAKLSPRGGGERGGEKEPKLRKKEVAFPLSDEKDYILLGVRKERRIRRSEGRAILESSATSQRGKRGTSILKKRGKKGHEEFC